MGDGHPFKVLEPELQRICELWLAGEKRGSGELSELIEKVNPFVTHAASRILRSPRLRYASRDPDGSAQRFWIVMLTVGFRRYDRSRGPLFAYGYKILARTCQQDNRRERVRWTCPLLPNHKSSAKPAEKLASKREWDLRFRKAVRQLPRDLRRAFLLKYRFRVSSAIGAARCGICVATYNTRVFQARARLRDAMAGDNWLDAA